MARHTFATDTLTVRPDRDSPTLLRGDVLLSGSSALLALRAARKLPERPPHSPSDGGLYTRPELAGEGPLSILEVCAITGLGRTMISKMIKSGELTARKAGRRTLVMRTDLWIWLASLPVMKPNAPEEGE